MRISTFLNALAVGTLLLSSFSSCGKDDDWRFLRLNPKFPEINLPRTKAAAVTTWNSTARRFTSLQQRTG